MIGNMTVQELKEKLDNNEELILIDCREQGEWDEAHIEAAQFLPLSNFEEEMKKITNKEAVVVCQCRSGKRSLAASR
jgi:rhodanese-related sulfurtransferase